MEIRDLRNGDWFWVHKEVLENYPKKIGGWGLLLYNALCYFANQETSSCYPSLSKIGELTGMSHPTICKYLKILEKEGLIKVENRQESNQSNVYYLLKVAHKGVVKGFNKVVKGVNKGSKSLLQGVVKGVNTNNNNKEQELKNNKGESMQRPQLGEIVDYVKERGNRINPENFFNYYSANGWKVGRNAMKDWKAAVRHWESREKGRFSAASVDKSHLFHQKAMQTLAKLEAINAKD